ncbi:2,3-bisphosphoglycerate-dependent phosphoglycerate mutase [Pelagibacterium halotolerans]|uniref:2,3-bisphosphoglycerate-dependent phosphoglycerate mutase n=1 Tax=Pelagibacterium halotolerans (strain DSM 22347 / JCM 15775 / CGMCC 1.7692 / B2) TaxID=1082931 RepID=G4R7T6_PELHB|nr:2,3-bisphosphoglycerate-dependent phosphoglycerate mutase [Pelagibacterium halotolerans]AEQ53346.1 phosphoglycerate mutase [Pelagibacterium halotolerans B2]QJR17042.1 2,3-bisphosphoglycerate-dependent phosphoglycerate mutase [Pelagibacterium halotolerans]SEA62511.1 phosphoglycerate mutase [Pelagibacterium halotolerans]
MTGTLILVRHGQSEWNLKNLFTGWKNPGLTDLGIEEAKKAGQALKARGTVPDAYFTSALTRAQRTLDLMLEEMGITDLTITRNHKLNERDYGDLSGLNKDDAREKWGEEQVHIWRRSYDVPPPGGESLKDTAARVLPYYEAEIEPLLKAGKTVLVTAHGNSLRALVMKLEGLDEEAILKREIATGAPIVYGIDAEGHRVSTEEL